MAHQPCACADPTPPHIKHYTDVCPKRNSDLSDIKSKLVKHAEENSVDIKNASTAQMMTLRCSIREIFSENYETKSLTMREQRDIFDMYEAYVALGGNGYIAGMLDEMKTWTVHTGL